MKKYRSYTNRTALDKANKALNNASRNTNNPPLASVQFVAARQLKSGDLSLTLGTAAHAEVARRHPNWAKEIDRDAKVRIPTWGLVVDRFPVKAMKLPEDMDQVERREMFTKIAARTDISPHADYNTLVLDPKAVRYVAEFMLKTGPLGQFRDVGVELEPPEAPDLEPLGIPG
ncbi:hypothetical protein ASPVEDRAFT_88973 [Aspergillus versicolor CBS 583.65]|uniref:Uncharacterized protein n=1 Tax=Aspergillus versicolor CBS 583.65 TaxID=1036611 RepID=A0A1L9Q1X8_ASPVE|nr:uncharacterized protein ASPVEDRAFT_88973 [Aspergillus versicolor CBS 583.65]OJJ07731.1 hypothetical protein ASPVEDRAFT_88973 [Aspergillus versicolor CBS 583.65]